jgi:flagellar basal body P-ring formation protein FlgA
MIISNTNPRMTLPALIGMGPRLRRRNRAAASAKFVLRFLAVLAVIALAGYRAEASVGPQLRGTVAAQGEMITLGDLFTEAGPAASTPVLSAPRPGKSTYVSAAQIAASVRGQGLNWRIPENITRVLVSRDGTQIPLQSLVEAVEDELRRRDIGDNFLVEINSRKTNLFVPLDGDTTVVIEGLDRDSESGTFSARVYLPGAEPGDRRVKVPGRVRVVVEVPVLSRRVPIGEEITEDDIAWIELAENKLARGLVQYPRDLIGQSPRRRIKTGTPIRFRDIQRPLLISKGTLVNMVVQTPFMLLSTTGKALDSGAAGDTVRVQNTESRQIVQAVVDARDRVRIPTHAKTVVTR